MAGGTFVYVSNADSKEIGVLQLDVRQAPQPLLHPKHPDDLAQVFDLQPERLGPIPEQLDRHRRVESPDELQAGREVRVIVTPDDINETRMVSLSDEIARRIEAELQYPGQIKVVLIRETRSVDFAR